MNFQSGPHYRVIGASSVALLSCLGAHCCPPLCVHRSSKSSLVRTLLGKWLIVVPFPMSLLLISRSCVSMKIYVTLETNEEADS